MIDPGSAFPPFDLEAHDGESVRSDDLAGRAYLVFFYPKASTPGCTVEVCRLRDRWDDLRELGLELFGVSYDSPESNRRFAEKQRLPFRLLSDADRSLAKACGADRFLLPVPKRISYLVGADGTVLRAWDSVNPDSHADEVWESARELGLGSDAS